MTTQSQNFTAAAIERLQTFLTAQIGEDYGRIQPLTPDASTREYFRISWEDSTAIACVYPEPFIDEEQSYLDVNNLFLISGLPVSEVFAIDGELGIIIHEDFGDRILRNVLEFSSEEAYQNYINKAIMLIAEIQAATETAKELDSIASRLAFDDEKLSWELNFFKTHYFNSLRGIELTKEVEINLLLELSEISNELSERPRVLCHRDFHAANLMVDHEGRLRIIDHQDARMGPASYDLVSLLLDRIIELPSPAKIREKRFYFLECRRQLGLEPIDPDEFAKEFRLMTIQRCLKAIGTFSFQTAKRSKTNYIQYINPMFKIVFLAAEKLNRFPHLQEIIRKQIE
jgi:hypothetical protein